MHDYLLIHHVYGLLPGRSSWSGLSRISQNERRCRTHSRRSEAWYHILFEHTGAATVIINEDGIIDQVNSEFEQMTGYSREEIEGKMNFTQIAHPDDLDLVRKYHHARRIDPASVPTFYPVRIYDRSGAIKTLHAVVALIPGTKKSIASYVDISEQKRSEDALKQVNRKLNLLSSITRHDINNQLMVLTGYIRLLEKKLPDTSLSDHFRRVTTAAQRISSMIQFTKEYEKIGVKVPVWQECRMLVGHCVNAGSSRTRRSEK